MTAPNPLHVAPAIGRADPMYTTLAEAIDALARCRAAPAVELFDRSTALNAAAQRLGLSVLDALASHGIVVLDPRGTLGTPRPTVDASPDLPPAARVAPPVEVRTPAFVSRDEPSQGAPAAAPATPVSAPMVAAFAPRIRTDEAPSTTAARSAVGVSTEAGIREVEPVRSAPVSKGEPPVGRVAAAPSPRAAPVPPPTPVPVAPRAPHAVPVSPEAGEPEGIGPIPPSPPATAADLQRLKAVGIGAAVTVTTPPPVVAAPALVVGKPVPVTAGGAAAAVAECKTFVDRIERWRGASAAEQYALLAWATYRLRHIQEEVPELSPDLRRKIEKLFPILTRFSEDERPGYLHGLAMTHRPLRGTWHDAALLAWRDLPCAAGAKEDLLEAVDQALDRLSDCDDEAAATEQLKRAVEAAWNTGEARLRELLAPRLVGYGDRLKGTGTLKTLRAQVRALEAKATDADAVEDATEPLPIGWEWLDKTQGARVLVFGGDRQPPIRRVKEAFGFEVVDHVTCLNMRKVQSGAERVAGHDLVLLQIRFLSHKASNMIVEACRSANKPFVALQSGISVAQVRVGLERVYGAGG